MNSLEITKEYEEIGGWGLISYFHDFESSDSFTDVHTCQYLPNSIF